MQLTPPESLLTPVSPPESLLTPVSGARRHRRRSLTAGTGSELSPSPHSRVALIHKLNYSNYTFLQFSEKLKIN